VNDDPLLAHIRALTPLSFCSDGRRKCFRLSDVEADRFDRATIEQWLDDNGGKLRRLTDPDSNALRPGKRVASAPTSTEVVYVPAPLFA
jgi:hypothetical protein